MSIEVDEILAKAWSRCAPNRSPIPFPRGFWPDVARVAVHLALDLPIDFRPTQCTIGNMPEPVRTAGRKSAGKIAAAERAANTAKLLAAMKGTQS